MTRSRSVTIAAIIVFTNAVWNVVNIVSRLVQGTIADSSLNSPPFAAALFVFYPGYLWPVEE